MSDQDELRDRLKRIVDETDDGGPAAQVVMKSLPRSPHYGASGSRDHPRQILTTTRPFTVSGFSKGTERKPRKGHRSRSGESSDHTRPTCEKVGQITGGKKAMNSNEQPTRRLVRPEPGRKYYNHMAKHTRGEWHRHWLLTSGQYIKTSNPYMRKGYGWEVIGEPGPELVKLRNRVYPPPHHRGSAADVEHHWPGCGHE